jgi:hypothetical protein
VGLKAVIIIGGSTSGSASGSGNINPTSLFYIQGVNASAPNTQNLPANPIKNQIIIVQDQGNNASTNNITISGNGNNIVVPNLGAEANVTIAGNGEDLWFNWEGTQWGILA